MKLRIVRFIVLMIVMYCCRKGESGDYQSSGKITGPDLRMCICCGGWQIGIDKETYNFDSLPPGSSIDLEKETFPVYVKLDWKMSDKNKCPKWIDISRIKKE